MSSFYAFIIQVILCIKFFLCNYFAIKQLVILFNLSALLRGILALFIAFYLLKGFVAVGLSLIRERIQILRKLFLDDPSFLIEFGVGKEKLGVFDGTFGV